MTRMLGRPLPDLRGGLITGSQLDGEWFAEVTLRAPLAYPDAEEHIFQMIEPTRADVVARLLQEAVARLAHIDDYFFIGSRFELIGRRDEDGVPEPLGGDDDSELGPHLDEMEQLLHHTQTRQDVERGARRQATQDIRMLATEAHRLGAEVDTLSTQRVSLAQQLLDARKERDTAIAKSAALEGKLRTSHRARTRLSIKMDTLESTVIVLRDRLQTARQDLAAREATLEELDEEVEDLRRENDEFMALDDIPSDSGGFDMSESSDPDDDDSDDSDEDPDEILFDGGSTPE